ncbi:hypothetical protein C8R46DRAFT_1042712 [Mycena filopes]|nr:hypothetical protein C8R46DRAFT_1042712 [Mycena filopes]
MAPATERPTPVAPNSSRAPWAFISAKQPFHDFIEYFHPDAPLNATAKAARQVLSNLQPLAVEFHRRYPDISDDIALFFATIRAVSKRLEARVSVRSGQPRPDFSALTAYTVPPHVKALLSEKKKSLLASNFRIPYIVVESAPAALEFSDDDFDDDLAPPPGKKPRRDSFQGSRASRRSPSPYEADDVEMVDPPTSPPRTRASTQASSARQASTAASSASRAGPSHRPGTAQVEVFIQTKPPRCFNKPTPQVEQGATTRGGVYAASTSSAANTVGLNPDRADFDEPVSAVLAIPHAIVQDYFTPRLYSKVFVKCLSCVNRTNQTCVPSEGKRCGPCHHGNISCSWNHSSDQQLTSLDEIRVQYGLTADFLFNLIARAVERRRKAEVLYGLYVSAIEDVATSDLEVVLGFKSQSATLDPEVLRRYFENPRDLQQIQALAVRTTEENNIGDLYMQYEESHPTTEPKLRNEFLPPSTTNSYFTLEVTGSDSWINVAPTNKANEQIFRTGSQVRGAPQLAYRFEESFARSSPVRPRPSGRSPPVASSSQSQFGEVGGALGGGGPRRSATPVATSVARADTVPGSSPAVVLYSKSCDSFGTH